MVARAGPAQLSGLLGLKLIHFARWVIIRRDQWPDLGQGKQATRQRLHAVPVATSTAPGTSISTPSPTAFRAGWTCSGTPAPNIRTRSRSQFKDYIGANQIHTNYYYNATPGAAQRDIKAALRVRREAADARQAASPAATRTAFAQAYSAGACAGWPIRWPRRATRRSPRWRRSKADMAPATNSSTCSAKKREAQPMPNLDGGHYFLTVLAPIRVDIMIDLDEIRPFALAPAAAGAEAGVARQRHDRRPASPPDARPSPFSLEHPEPPGPLRDHPWASLQRAHVGRYAGRRAYASVNPLAPQPVDQLGTPYLLFAADIDAPAEGDALRAYTDTLWATMTARSGDHLRPLRRLRRRRNGREISRLYQQAARSRRRCRSTTTGRTGFRS